VGKIVVCKYVVELHFAEGFSVKMEWRARTRGVVRGHGKPTVNNLYAFVQAFAAAAAPGGPNAHLGERYRQITAAYILEQRSHTVVAEWSFSADLARAMVP